MRCSNMRFTLSTIAITFLSCMVLIAPSAAQLAPTQIDALSKLQAAQKAVACSPAEASSCAEMAGKLMPLILGDSPMIENLRRLTDEIGGRVTGSPEMAKAVQWGVAGFRAAGVDVHTEKYTMPATWREGATQLTIASPATAATQLRAVSEGMGPATAAGGIEANIID